MKIFNTLIKTVAIAAVLVFTGCEKVEAPKESVKLVSESALLKGIEGENIDLSITPFSPSIYSCHSLEYPLHTGKLVIPHQ